MRQNLKRTKVHPVSDRSLVYQDPVTSTVDRFQLRVGIVQAMTQFVSRNRSRHA